MSQNQRSTSPNNEEGKENPSCMISKYKNKIIHQLEKIMAERKQAGSSGEQSPYRVKLSALDNSWVMFTINSTTTPQKTRSKLSNFIRDFYIIEGRSNYSHNQSPLRNSPLPYTERDNESEEEKDSFRNKSLNSIQITNEKIEK